MLATEICGMEENNNNKIDKQMAQKTGTNTKKTNQTHAHTHCVDHTDKFLSEFGILHFSVLSRFQEAKNIQAHT